MILKPIPNIRKLLKEVSQEEFTAAAQKWPGPVAKADDKDGGTVYWYSESSIVFSDSDTNVFGFHDPKESKWYVNPLI